MSTCKERFRKFFADSTAPGRLRSILAALLLGVVFVALLAVTYRCACPWPREVGTVCRAVIDSPPWALLTSVAATPALVLTWWWRTVHKDQDIRHKQVELDIAKREERSKRFVEAVRLLADGKLQARLGAVYSLESLALDAVEERARVVETLCAFVREEGRETPDNESHAEEWDDFRQDGAVQAAFTVLGRFPGEDARLDLHSAKLGMLDGARAKLRGADLRRTNFMQTCLAATDLEGAILDDAYLAGVDLRSANLKDATLRRATLQAADLAGASLVGTCLVLANLKDVTAASVLLCDATCCGADFRRAQLIGANLSGARLDAGAFPMPDGRRKAVPGADLRGADLKGAVLEGAILTGAKYDGKTEFPDGFDPEAAGMERDPTSDS